MTLWSMVVVTLLSQSSSAGAEQSTPAPPPDAAKEAKAPALSWSVTPYGYIDVQFTRTDPPSPKPDTHTFELRRARLGLKGEVTPYVGFAILYDGADNALKDVYAAVKAIPNVELRLGQFKTPFGYEQQESDPRLLWLNNSYIIAALARGRDSRDLGVLALGKWKVGGSFGVDASAALVNGAGPNVRDDLDEKNLWGRLGASWTQGELTTRLGASYGYGRQVVSTGPDGKFGVQSGALDDTYVFFHTLGVDASFDSPWVFAVMEVARSDRSARRYAAPGVSTASTLAPRGGYVAAYGKTPWNVGPVVRAEAAVLPVASGTDAGAALNPDWNVRYTVGAYYDVVTVNARFVVNYEFDASPEAIRTGDRFLAFAQVVF